MSTPGLWERVERMLLQRGINTFLELGLWIMLVYIVIGVGYTVFHVELMGQLQSALTGAFPIFSDIAALVVMVAGLAVSVGHVLSVRCGRLRHVLAMSFGVRAGLYRHDR